ncbi:MAG: M6 family metalloprotease domain-containing protein [Bacteroidales bacterium]|nr:M6 family metalloprotease domain-containing protein [Bacteroidales bacterium]
MKKALFTLVLSFAFCVMSYAVPAYPWPIKYRQPDGSVVTIQLHGDENYHYTTMGGKVVARGKDGFYHAASLPARSNSSIKRVRTANARLRSGAVDGRAISMGQKRFLIILVEFQDLEFTVENPHDAFSAMLNQTGYSANGGTGSVHDYYYENSTGQFDPVYDVVGPVKVSKGFAEYGKNDDEGHDVDPRGAFAEACKIAHEQGIVNFAQYDNDRDGYVDNVFFYYAGHNEAEAGGDDTIWPHASGLNPRENGYDGVKVYSYACSSEYKGSSGTNMAGIGTFCHEFGHVLGLPDFYDVDYEKNGSNDTVYDFSLMSSGNYNNNGRTPPYLSILERWMLGWADVSWWDEAGQKSLRPVQENSGAMTRTSVEDEFFLYEVRSGTGWDSYIKVRSSDAPVNGLVVYHVDYSTNQVADAGEAIKLWGNNSLNAYAVHPCYYMVLPKSSWSNFNDMLYPGTTGTTTFEGTDWASLKTRYKLSDIQYSDGTVTLNLEVPNSLILNGKVTDSNGAPLSGVTVEVALANESAVQALKQRQFISLKELRKVSKYSTSTGQDGTYELEIPGSGSKVLEIVWSKEMFNTEHRTVTTYGGTARQDVTMLNYSEGKPATLSKNNGSAGYAIGYTTAAENYSATLAMRYSAEELKPYVGYNIDAITFMMRGSSATRVDVFVDFGAERAFTKTITSPKFNKKQTIDISDAGIVIPSGKDVFIGYAVKEISGEQYWMSIDGADPVDGGGMIVGNFITSGTTEWQTVKYNFIIDADLTQVVSPYAGLGIRVINRSEDGKYTTGSTFPLTFVDNYIGGIPDSVAWYFDGQPVSGEAITLTTSGQHTVKAVVTYSNGNIEEIEQVIEVL